MFGPYFGWLTALFASKPKTETPDPWGFPVYAGLTQLDRDEKRAIVLVHMANAIGICPTFAEHPDPNIRSACQRLMVYGVVYLARDSESPDAPRGYCFRSGYDATGEEVFKTWSDRTGLSFGDADKV